MSGANPADTLEHVGEAARQAGEAFKHFALTWIETAQNQYRVAGEPYGRNNRGSSK